MVGKALCECLAVDILHQDTIVRKGNITDKTGMFQTIACLKLLAKGFLIAYVIGKLWLQLLQEVQLAVELDTESVAGGTLYLQRFKGFKRLLTIRKLRRFHLC